MTGRCCRWRRPRGRRAASRRRAQRRDPPQRQRWTRGQSHRAAARWGWYVPQRRRRRSGHQDVAPW